MVDQYFQGYLTSLCVAHFISFKHLSNIVIGNPSSIYSFASSFQLPTSLAPTYSKMSHLKFYAYEGAGQQKQRDFWYSQAVRVGDRIECAGQGS